jgi:hypothetical protein
MKPKNSLLFPQPSSWTILTQMNPAHILKPYFLVTTSRCTVRSEVFVYVRGPTSHLVTCWFSFPWDVLYPPKYRAAGLPFVGSPRLLSQCGDYVTVWTTGV